MTVQELIEMLQTHGWRECHAEDELRQFRHAEQKGFVTLSGKLDSIVPQGASRSLRRYALNEVDG